MQKIKEILSLKLFQNLHSALEIKKEFFYI